MKEQESRAKKNQNPMNILFMTDCFLPHAGGSRIYYYNLYSHMRDVYPDQVTILTKKVPGWEQFDATASYDALRIVRHFQPLKDLSPLELPKAVFPLVEAVARVLSRKTDLIHAGDLYPPGMISLWLKRIVGIPYLTFCHGEDVTLTERYQYQRVMRNRIYKSADAVVAACEFAKQELLQIGVPENKIVKIMPGVDWKRFFPRPATEALVRKYGLENRRVLLTIARLTPRKGHATVLRALAKVLHSLPDTTYLIVGKGGERERLEQLAAELGISHAVRFVGYVPEKDLADFYNLCNAFVMMNHEENGDIEGFGMVFLEASAVGKVVIGGRSGGTSDSVEHGKTGFLLQPDNVEELAGTLDLVLRDTELQNRLGMAGLQRARADFSWETRAARLRDLSEMIVERARTKSQPAGSVFPSSTI
jgi:phosphatidylinositol alpha-1,6-mannosyltransferase